jgi:Tol biopolymer transport system component
VDTRTGEVTLFAPAEGGSLYALSPDGETLAYVANDASGRQQLWLATPDGEDPQLVTDAISVGGPTWSPDGRWIAYAEAFGSGRRAEISVLHVGTGRVSTITDEPHDAFDPSWSPDGEAVVFSTSLPGDGGALYGIVRRADLDLDDRSGVAVATGSETLAGTETMSADSGVLSPVDGTLAIAAWGGSWIELMEEGGEPRILDNEPPGGVWALSWSPDGTMIAYASDDRVRPSVWIVDVATGESRRLSDGTPVGWIDDGMLLVDVAE